MGGFQTFVDTSVARNKNNTLYSNELWELTEDAERFLSLQTITSVLLLVCSFISLLYVSLVGYRKPQNGPRQRSLLRLLIGHIFFMMCLSIAVLIGAVARFDESSWLSCSMLGSVPVFTYVCANGFTYGIYLKRAAASASFSRRSKLASTLYQLCVLGTYGVGGFLVIVWLTIHGKMYYQGVCQQFHQWELALIFYITDLSLASSFLYVFLEPVLNQIKTMHTTSSANSRNTQKMKHTTKKNFLCSSISICSTSAYMLMVTIIPTKDPTPENCHVRFLFWGALCIVSLINMISSMAITSGVWAPDGFSRASGAASKVYSTGAGNLEASTKLTGTELSEG